MTRHATAWAARCWWWKPDADRSADVDPLHIQQEKMQRAPSKALAHAVGRKLAAAPLATSPGLYDVMRGTPDRHSADGYDWQVEEEVRP